MKNLTILCGGGSTEHDISLLSAQNVLNSLGKSKLSVTIIYISPSKGWFRLCSDESLVLLTKGHRLDDVTHFDPVVVSFGQSGEPWMSVSSQKVYPADAVFPVLHGYQGEDGCIQGLLNMLDLPYVGADLLASAQLMNKVETKRLLTAAGIPVVPFYSFSAHEIDTQEVSSVLKAFFAKHKNVFVKPVSSGSSVGVSNAQDWVSLQAAIASAALYDEWVMVEPAMTGRELEVAVLYNLDEQKVAGPGEIIKPAGVFYDFDSKYVDANAVSTTVCADLPDDEKEAVRAVACAAVKAVNCEGMCRVDGFYQDSVFVINELNSIPGFTGISLFPSMFANEGIDTETLITTLVAYAFKRHKRLSIIDRDFALQQREKV